MCIHKYKIDYNIPSMQFKENCEYPNLYKKWTGLMLPMDKYGNCIFHSSDIDWKRTQNLPKFFLDVLLFANKDEAVETIDVREFIMTGGTENIESEHYECCIGTELFTEDVLYSVTLKNLSIDKDIVFTFSHFIDKYSFNFLYFNNNSLWHKCEFDKNLHIQMCEFSASAIFEAVFCEGIQIDDTIFEHLGMNNSKIYEVCEFRDVSISKSAHFVQTKITGTLANFRTYFDGYVNFDRTVFDSAVTFEGSHFKAQVDFKKTKFKNEVYFKDNLIEGTMLFLGAETSKKMFDKSVEFDITEQNISKGKLVFQNINMLQIVEPYLARLIELSRSNLVEIGSNCLKYRCKYEKIIPISKEGRQLVQDIATTFVSFFNIEESINLGVEIIDKSSEKVLVIYYTSDNLSESEFTEKLSNIDKKLWDFIGAGAPQNKEKNKKQLLKTDIWLKSIFNFVRLWGQFAYNPTIINTLQTTFFNEDVSLNSRKQVTEITYNIVINSLKTNNLKISQSNMKINQNTVYGTQYVADVINFLASQNNFSDIDNQMFDAIGRFAKDDNEKKELAEAIKEIKSDKPDEQKQPFKSKIVNFLVQNKEIFKTVIKVGISSLVTYYGLSGVDALLNLE